MNPRIATLAEGYADRPAADREWATYATADADHVYRLFPLTVGRVEYFAAIYWDQISGNVALPPVCELD